MEKKLSWSNVKSTLKTYFDTIYQQILVNPVTGTGTTNYVSKFTGTGTLGNSLIYDNGTNVGIGTTSPSTNLHIFGNSFSVNPSIKVTHDVGFVYQSIEVIGSAFDGGGIISVDTGGNLILQRGSSESMRINGQGNVGINTTSPQGKFHVFQGTTLGGTTGNSLILQTLQNTGGAGGSNVYIKDYAVRDATGTGWTTWRHHNSIDIDGVYNTPGTDTRCFWERDPSAGIHYFGNSTTTALTVNGVTNTIIANNIEVQENTTGIYNNGGDLAIGDWNGNNYGTTFYGPGGVDLINLAANFTQFYYPITYPFTQGTSEVNGEVAYWGGGSVVSGSLYYYNSSGNWAATDADAASTATGMLGIARATGTASTVGMLLRGRARFTVNPNYTALTTVGAPLYVSTRLGEFSQTAPTGTGDIVRIIGYVQSTVSDEIYFCPDNVWVEVI